MPRPKGPPVEGSADSLWEWIKGIAGCLFLAFVLLKVLGVL